MVDSRIPVAILNMTCQARGYLETRVAHYLAFYGSVMQMEKRVPQMYRSRSLRHSPMEATKFLSVVVWYRYMNTSHIPLSSMGQVILHASWMMLYKRPCGHSCSVEMMVSACCGVTVKRYTASRLSINIIALFQNVRTYLLLFKVTTSLFPMYGVSSLRCLCYLS